MEHGLDHLLPSLLLAVVVLVASALLPSLLLVVDSCGVVVASVLPVLMVVH